MAQKINSNNFKNNYSVYVYSFNTDQGTRWIADYPDIPGCSGFGETPAEAFKNAQDNLYFHISALQDNGFDNPVEYTYTLVRNKKKRTRQ